MKIKVCGMRDTKNIQELSLLKPDFMGFIFYKKSKRYATNIVEEIALKNLDSSIAKVGVFVDSPTNEVLETISKYQLQYAQLHGNESVEYCENLKNKGIKIIKAISITPDFDFQTINIYNKVVDFFLFDTATPQKGGSGIAFDWQLLDQYKGPIPFLLAGGIDQTNINDALNLQNKYLFGLDLNSKFEIEPGLKDIEKLKNILI
jgi:phosphoribosylanthranilate isomerase